MELMSSFPKMPLLRSPTLRRLLSARQLRQLPPQPPFHPTNLPQYATPIPRRSELNPRYFSGAGAGGGGGGSGVDYDEEVDKINVKFAEAREEIEMALESKETVYFDDEAECAREAAGVVFGMYDSLLGRLNEGEKASLRRSMGLKIEQLKAEIGQLDDLIIFHPNFLWPRCCTLTNYDHVWRAIILWGILSPVLSSAEG